MLEQVPKSLLEESQREVLGQFAGSLAEQDKKLGCLQKWTYGQITNSLQIDTFSESVDVDDQCEHSDVDRLLQTCGDEALCKVLRVLSHLCDLLQQHCEHIESAFISPMASYRALDCQPIDVNACDSDDSFARLQLLLPTFVDLLRFLSNTPKLISNVVCQLNAITSSIAQTSAPTPSGQELPELKSVRFDYLLQKMAEFLSTLVQLDRMLLDQHHLKCDLQEYEKWTQMQGLQSSDEPLHERHILIALLQRIQRELFAGPSLFTRFTQNVLASLPSSDAIAKDSVLMEQFALFLRTQLLEIEVLRLHSDRKWLEMYTFFSLYVLLFRRDDKRLYKLLLETQKRFNVLCVHLSANVTFCPEQVFRITLPKSFTDRRNFEGLVQQQEITMKQSLSERVSVFQAQQIKWSARMQQILAFKPKIEDVTTIQALPAQIATLEEGVALTQQCINLIRSHIYLHLLHNRPMVKSAVISIGKLVVIAKSIDLLINRFRVCVQQIVSRQINVCCYTLLKLLINVRTRMFNDVRKYSEKKLDVLSTLILMCNALHGPILVAHRQTLIHLCESILSNNLTESEAQEMHQTLVRIRSCGSLLRLQRQVCDCSFLYTNASLLDVIWSNLVENDLDSVEDIKYIFQALTDFKRYFIASNRQSNPTSDLIRELIRSDHDRFERHVWNVFQQRFLTKLCESFETELRIQIHDELLLDDSNPFKRPLCNFVTVFESGHIRFFDRLVSIREYVQNHLNEIAYKLTALALHDWRTYELMLCLASKRYGFEFVRSQLPMQNVEQGLDVLRVAREIDNFVNEYWYNLNNQAFIQKTAEGPEVNTLQIVHVSNSLRTQGLGVVNTAVNHTYRYLKKRLSMCSKFLYEEHIRFRLLKEQRDFRESGTVLFPYARAEKLLNTISKLGYVRETNTFLDEFRLLITEMGNALGLVRMLRGAALNCCAAFANRLPDLDELHTLRFVPLCRDENFGSETQVAAQNLDEVLDHVCKNFTDASDYLALLVRAFLPLLAQQETLHLQGLYILLPALTLNYVQHMLLCKERLQRRTSGSATFTDDGFVIGLAYLLRLFDQWKSFESLQWFESIDEHVQHLKEQISQPSKSKDKLDEEKLAQTSALTFKRLEMFHKEFQLLRYNLISCKVFFRSELSNENVAD